MHSQRDVSRKGSRLVEQPDERLDGAEIVHGTVRTGAQMHFYIETMCAFSIPGPYDQMTIYNSTQNPNGNQASVARVLGVRANQVSVVVEQIGGGFGGNSIGRDARGPRPPLGAWLQRPVRLLYDRATDSLMVGKRHPYLGEYHVACTTDGILSGMRLDLHSEARVPTIARSR